jgi:hypothetical protein
MTTYGSSDMPTVGTRVITADGDEIGRIKEIEGDCFKVDAPMQPDYWLGMDTISTETPGGVQLNFPHSQLGDVKEEAKDHKGVHRHTM